MVYGRWTTQLPSRFVDELPLDTVEAASETGYYGGGPGMQQAASRWDEAPAFSSGYDSPGWKRAQERGAQFSKSGGGSRQPIIDGQAKLVAVSEPSAGAGWSKGERVFHQKFGYGHVRGIEGNKLTVVFEKAGEKKVIDSFVEKA
jgi:DNA helicase-2/ATP-dependent DNA helicase PcrA